MNWHRLTSCLLGFMLLCMDGIAQQKDKIEEPQYPGGRKELIKYIEKNLVYPDDMLQLNIEGEVVIEFFVERNGTISGSYVIKSPSETFSDEAIRLVRNMPRWVPGKKNGQPVRYKMTMPVNFKIKRSSTGYMNKTR